MFTILVTGDRNWHDAQTMRHALDLYRNKKHVTLIEGGAAGADIMARHMAYEYGWDVRECVAAWRKYGKAAGPIRNQEMLNYNPDVVLAFHNDLDNSKGTKDMISRAKKKGTPCLVFSSEIEAQNSQDT